MTQAAPEPLLVTVKDAMAIISVKTTKLYEMINDGTLGTVYIGSRRLVNMEDIKKVATSGHRCRPTISPNHSLSKNQPIDGIVHLSADAGHREDQS